MPCFSCFFLFLGGLPCFSCFCPAFGPYCCKNPVFLYFDKFLLFFPFLFFPKDSSKSCSYYSLCIFISLNNLDVLMQLQSFWFNLCYNNLLPIDFLGSHSHIRWGRIHTFTAFLYV